MPNPTADFPWEWQHVAATTVPPVSSASGALHTIVLNGITTEGEIEIYDGLDAATGALIGVLGLTPTTGVSVSVQPITLTYDLKIDTGIHLQYIPAVGADLTVTYV
ncbi:hypothetical protein ES703_39600 [subsurface metagenome]